MLACLQCLLACLCLESTHTGMQLQHRIPCDVPNVVTSMRCVGDSVCVNALWLFRGTGVGSNKKRFSCKLSKDSKLHAPPWGASGRLARFKIHNFKLQRSNKLHTRAREERITSTCTTRPSRTVNTPIGPIQKSKLLQTNCTLELEKKESLPPCSRPSQHLGVPLMGHLLSPCRVIAVAVPIVIRDDRGNQSRVRVVEKLVKPQESKTRQTEQSTNTKTTHTEQSTRL